MNNFSHKLYILTEQDQTYIRELEKHALPDLEITSDRSQATILLASPPLVAKHLEEFPQLEWLQSVYAGIDALTKPELRNDYELTNVKGIFGQQISEYVLGYTISHYRHFNTYQEQQKSKQWQPHSYSSLQGKQMVILGTGSIGSFLAKTANAFGIKTIGLNRTGIPAKDSPFVDTYHIHELATALTNADIIVNTLPATKDTAGLLNLESLNSCHNAILFNVGRGQTVDLVGLLAAIKNQNIAHAFLDVFSKEPIEGKSELWDNEKITITPHIAASSFPYQVVEQFKDNYLRWRDGFKLNNLVDFSRGY
ncbi:D-2-hydroxyacid dehydrogenase [Vibrio paucivorans]|uniref:D-2-hydroxyacid dehydrogenase n=1 Tax=Vibrio paucivorans TaxID=2829489 RepID=A0A9X3CDN1_9VIBR|nr:D-2-hydroxyacid dehydrogenase [Vibrio paucivorans]MCW8333816.1 D-2-hydroxyacid dehydrogenase [Vibrio paucivorans]